MSGRAGRDRGAQLALLDALAFFAVSALICSVMVSSVAHKVDWERQDAIGQAGPSELLAVFLEASVGQGFPLAPDLELTGREQFGEALLAAADMVRRGFPADGLAPFLAHCREVLGILTPSTYIPRLQVLSDEGVGWVVLVTIGGDDADHPDSVSAYQNLAGRDGTPMVVALTLSPALLPHVVPV